MALRRWIFCLLLTGILCGCGSSAAPQTTDTEIQNNGQTAQSGNADGGQSVPDKAAGSAQAENPTQELTDPPIDDEAAGAADGQNLPLSGLVICLDPGHGVTNARAQERVSPLSDETKPAYVSGASGRNQTEEQVNLAVAQLTRTELEALGAQVVMTRQTNEATVSNIERAQIANRAGADLCIRIHADGADNASAHGMSMQVPAGSLLGTPAIEQPSARAAEHILAAVTQATGAHSRGLTQRSDLTGFNWSEVPCILLEMGFLSNEQEDALLATQEYRQKIARGIADGVCRWIDSGR